VGARLGGDVARVVVGGGERREGREARFAV
jgi:hypothetical protein